MIYLDNAATSFPKPEAVYRRVDEIQRHGGGNPGRGSHRMALDASRVVFETRESIASLLNLDDSGRIVFTKNGTEAINLALKGLAQPGDHLVTTTIEHNAVANTVHRLEEEGVRVTRVGGAPDGTVMPLDIGKAIEAGTRLVCITHASNLFGTIEPVGEIAEVCHGRGVPLMVDAAQTVGALPVDVTALGIDIVAATGHKALYGPQGTGFLYVREGIEPLTLLIEGGTGEEGETIETPERYESGTMNTPGIGGLGEGVEFLLNEGVVQVRRYEEELMGLLIDGLRAITGITVIGSLDASQRVSLLSFTVDGREAGEVGRLLDDRYDIMTRSGLHCAPSAHRVAGTYPDGAVRVSPGYFTTPSEIAEFLDAIREIGGGG
ncbi:MAG: aminotransferase class V-fold PLP-dependent enzyme [Thermodesulfobacteriota bacterium]